MRVHREPPPLPQLLSRFAQRRVLVVGDLVADHYIYGQTDRVSREAPVLVVRFEDSEVKLGGGANAAANARSLGAKVTAVGCLGKDEMGRALRRLFDAAAIEVEAVTSSHTETKTRIYAGGLNTTRQQMLRLDKGAPGGHDAKKRRALAQAVRRAAKDADAILVSDYGAGAACDEVLEVLRDLAKGGLPVCADSRYALHAFAGLTVCKPNEPELAALAGMPVQTEGDLMFAGRRVQTQLACEALLVTRGRSGMTLFDAGGDVTHLPAHGPAGAVDVTGAGDTVGAALTVALAAGAPVPLAARLANVAGALVVQKQGTATVSREELARELGAGG